MEQFASTPLTPDAMGRQLSDAILMKTVLEGKDFQTARKEASEEAEDSPPTTPPSSQNTPVRETRQPDFFLEIQSVQITQVSLEIQTPDASLSIQATRIEAQRVTLSASRGPVNAPQDPLVIDMDGTGPRTTGKTDAQAFDLMGDGDQRLTSFVSGNTAFLALDRNGNGRIDDGKELFGDQHGAADGYAELSRFDQNQDQQINHQDDVYAELRLLYGNGTLQNLSQAGIASIQLNAQNSSSLTTGGDQTFKRSTVELDTGQRLQSYALYLQRFDAQA